MLTSSTFLPAVGQGHRRGTGQRGLADAALAGEEQVAGRVGSRNSMTHRPFSSSPSGRSSASAAARGRSASLDAAPARPARRGRVVALGDDRGRSTRTSGRQATCSGAERRLHVVVADERRRLLGQVVALDRRRPGP